MSAMYAYIQPTDLKTDWTVAFCSNLNTHTWYTFLCKVYILLAIFYRSIVCYWVTVYCCDNNTYLLHTGRCYTYYKLHTSGNRRLYYYHTPCIILWTDGHNNTNRVYVAWLIVVTAAPGTFHVFLFCLGIIDRFILINTVSSIK
jgi:hypothetical protein